MIKKAFNMIDPIQITEWCKLNRMRIFVKKCKAISITKRKNPHTLNYIHVGGTFIEEVTLHRDLGLFTKW